MDGYPMPVADLLVDVAAGHKVISFMDGNAGYNQIFMAIEDISKTAFKCLGHIGLFEWIFMTFGLKNAGATYQRAMNYIFHKLIGKIVEIYIDDVMIFFHRRLQPIKLGVAICSNHGAVAVSSKLSWD
jgi:hypothetical protein